MGTILETFGPSEIRARFDLVSFDPRGITVASTAVQCGAVEGFGDLDWTPDDAAERDALERGLQGFVTACENDTGPLLGLVDSWNVARDMDQMRRALGEESMTYLGVSYGTVIGAAYAELFPGRVRALVLDSAVAPGIDGVAWARDRAVNIERVFEAFADDCDGRSECAAKFGGDLRAAYHGAVEHMATTPFVDPVTGETMNESLLGIYLGQLLLAMSQSVGSSQIEDLIEQASAGTLATMPVISRSPTRR
jgi:pimeloyl-ACP methyl ester carboxylesterase